MKRNVKYTFRKHTARKHLDDMQQLLAQYPRTAWELAEALQLDLYNANVYIRHLQSTGAIHIDDWALSRPSAKRRYVPIYALGSAPDAERPKPDWAVQRDACRRPRLLKWTPERDKALLHLYRMGWGMQEMANELGTSYCAVRGRLRTLKKQHNVEKD